MQEDGRFIPTGPKTGNWSDTPLKTVEFRAPRPLHRGASHLKGKNLNRNLRSPAPKLFRLNNPALPVGFPDTSPNREGEKPGVDVHPEIRKGAKNGFFAEYWGRILCPKEEGRTDWLGVRKEGKVTK